MSADILFMICNMAVLPGWLLLVFLPSWKWTTRLISSVILPGLVSLVYLYLAARYLLAAEGDFGSLQGVAALFENPHVLLAGWIHYLAFDLFIGSWQVRDAQQIGLSHWLVVPALALTLMAGPVGLVSYFAIRAVKTRTLLI